MISINESKKLFEQGLRWCNRCKTIKKLDEFTNSLCKECRPKSKEYKKYMRDYQRKWQQEKRLRILTEELINGN